MKIEKLPFLNNRRILNATCIIFYFCLKDSILNFRQNVKSIFSCYLGPIHCMVDQCKYCYTRIIKHGPVLNSPIYTTGRLSSMDNMLNRSAQTGPPNVRKRCPVFPPAGRSSHCALARWRIVLFCCLDNLTSWHLFCCPY